MNFEYPALLFAIPMVVLLGAVYVWRSRPTMEKRRFPLFLASLCFVLIALANPYWRTVPSRESIKGVDLVLITDVSQSMFSSANGKTSRVDLARKFIKTLLPSFTGSQVALIYFAGDAQVGSPFTTDLPAISLFIDSIAPGMSAQAGTRTDSLENVLDQLLKTRTAGKLPLILFFSDGEFFDSGRGFENYLKEKGLRIFTYLCGSQKAPVLNYDLTAPVLNAFTTPNESSLRRLSEAGKGQFFSLSKEGTNAILTEVNKRVDDFIVEGQSVPDYRPVPFLILALFFLLLYQWVPLERAKTKNAMALALLILSFTISMKADESRKLFQEALDAAKKGDREMAAKKLNRLPLDFFPSEKQILLGNLYYQGGKYDQAIQQYEKVLERDPFNTTARWNWEVALKRRSDPAQQPPKPRKEPVPEKRPENKNALLQYVDQQEKEQRQNSNRANRGKSEFAW